MLIKINQGSLNSYRRHFLICGEYIIEEIIRTQRERTNWQHSAKRKSISVSICEAVSITESKVLFRIDLVTFLRLGRDNTAMWTYKRKCLIGDYIFRGLVHDHHGSMKASSRHGA